MIASLPWYDRPETAAANDRLWAGVRGELGFGPERLTRPTDYWAHWRTPGLVLSQACGLTWPLGLKHDVRLVAAPVYDLPECPPGRYYSVVVCHKDDPRPRFADFAGARFAYNSRDSQSGFGIALTHAAREAVPIVPGPETGAHRASAQAVAEGRADLAVIDAVTWEMIARWDAAAAALRVLDRTPTSPAPPYVTAKANDPAPIAAALAAAIEALDPADRALLVLRGVATAHDADYDAIPLPADLLAT
jgi:ABC-type phosphate/phosphonate transport system substrate-binding protein